VFCLFCAGLLYLALFLILLPGQNAAELLYFIAMLVFVGAIRRGGPPMGGTTPPLRPDRMDYPLLGLGSI